MLGPSGFFQPVDDGILSPSSDKLEVFHISGNGFNILYKICRNGRFFIYKGLKHEYIGNPLYEELLKKDFNIGFSLSHNGICQYFGMVKLPEAGNCIIMEWIDGCTLEELISGKRLTPAASERIICQICDALAYMHRKQVVHRDLKPENIMVTYNGQNVKIIDFGLSDADSYGILKLPAGTRAYASPELIAGDSVDGRSDIWSLGMIMEEMPGKWWNIAARCLRRDRRRRYMSAEDVKKSVIGNGRRRAVIAFSAICLMISLAMAWMSYFTNKERNAVRESVLNESPASPESAAEKTGPVHPDRSESTVGKAAEEPGKAMEGRSGQDNGAQPETGLQQNNAIDSETLDEMFDRAAEMIL